jgi:hypothetical protein
LTTQVGPPSLTILVESIVDDVSRVSPTTSP